MTLFSRFRSMTVGSQLLLLFLLALVVRVIGIHYGYWFGDERINSAARVLAGELVPGQHFYPPLLNYITAVFFAALYVVGRLFVAWHSLADFRAQYFADPTPFYITARFLIGLISAAIAPLFYLIARECGLNQKYSFLVGLFGVFIPGMVLLSHISKGDVPLSVCVVLIFYLALKQIKSPASWKLNFLMGLSIALALSFKQSYIFIFFPFFTAFLLVYYLESKDLSALIKSTFFAFVVTVFFWLIFNIGILLDFSNFLDYQKIQAVMSVREDKNIGAGISAWWDIVADPYFGVNIFILVLFLLTPLFLYLQQQSMHRGVSRLLLSFWLALVVGSFIVLYLSGARQQSGLWVPYMTGIQLLAVINLFLVITYAKALFVNLAKGLVFLCLAVSVYGVFVVDKQAIAKPIVLSVEELLREHYDVATTKMLTSFTLRSPQTIAMKKTEYARHQRIADKYSVVLPERSKENTSEKVSLDAIHYFNMPSAFYGLEHSDDDTLGDAMQPYAWPLQKEEWYLDYWVNQGFEVFILGDHDYALNKSTVVAITAFHREIKERCQLVEHFDPTKPLYIEFSATVYDCIN